MVHIQFKVEEEKEWDKIKHVSVKDTLVKKRKNDNKEQMENIKRCR